jgi:hypothetical protein
MRKITKAALVGGLATAAIATTVSMASPVQAFPGFGYCPGGGGGFGSFGYCDGPTYPDGSYDHTVSAMGGWSSSRVRPPDPANPMIPLPWVPGQNCAFRK